MSAASFTTAVDCRRAQLLIPHVWTRGAQRICKMRRSTRQVPTNLSLLLSPHPQPPFLPALGPGATFLAPPINLKIIVCLWGWHPAALKVRRFDHVRFTLEESEVCDQEAVLEPLFLPCCVPPRATLKTKEMEINITKILFPGPFLKLPPFARSWCGETTSATCTTHKVREGSSVPPENNSIASVLPWACSAWERKRPPNCTIGSQAGRAVTATVLHHHQTSRCILQLPNVC